MNKIWYKKDKCTNVEEIIERNTGMKINEFLNPPKNPYLHNLNKVVDKIKYHISNKSQITVISDYDVDGVTSSAILHLVLTSLGVRPNTIIPKRFSEGYGVSLDAIDKANSGLLITVDNGISAIDEIKLAKDKGLDVIIVDHHLMRDDGALPCADVILNPHIENMSEFKNYCGAGLCYRIANELTNDKLLLQKISVLAMLGTVADVMPLHSDNRNIVIEGLKNINDGNVTKGLACLLKQMNTSHIDETTVGYFIGPCINACGRLKDDGATKSFRLLASESNEIEKLDKVANTLIRYNEKRKELVSSALHSLENSKKLQTMAHNQPICIYQPDLHEGIIGIIAGKLSEKYKRPCVILTNSEENNILKGSGRSPDGVDLKELLDSVSETLLKYGGHSGAAGLSLNLEDYETFEVRFCEACAKYNFEGIKENPYDIEIEANDVDAFYQEIKKYAPFGEGNPRIIVKIKKFTPIFKYGKKFRTCGSENQHIKIFGKHNDIIGFDIASDFLEFSKDKTIEVIGNLSENYWNGNVTVQIEAVDFVKRNSKKRKICYNCKALSEVKGALFCGKCGSML